MYKILLIGPRTNKKDPSLTGGAIVLFENLISELKKKDIDILVIDTNKKNYLNIIVAYISILLQIIIKQRSCQYISLHSSRDYLIFGTFIVILGKLFKKNTSLRKFGGEAERTYSKSRGLKKSILRFVFSRVDTLFFEMKYLVDFFKNINNNTYWFPNVRNRLLEPKLPRKFTKKFVFISMVRHEKGVDEILDASNQLNDSYMIDLYGPIKDKKYSEEYFNSYKVTYKGALNQDNVLKSLDKYDVLLLPTYYKGEGYPGIIIEAYSLGIPIIATSLQGIKEIVDPWETGILIEPKSINELTHAIQYFSKENYVSMSEKAYKKFDNFESDLITKQFIETLTNA